MCQVYRIRWMSLRLFCWKQVKQVRGQEKPPILLVQRQLRHLIWNPLPLRLARRPALQAHLAARRRENQ